MQRTDGGAAAKSALLGKRRDQRRADALRQVVKAGLGVGDSAPNSQKHAVKTKRADAACNEGKEKKQDFGAEWQQVGILRRNG